MEDQVRLKAALEAISQLQVENKMLEKQLYRYRAALEYIANVSDEAIADQWIANTELRDKAKEALSIVNEFPQGFRLG